jgi:hypothetical protein
VADARDPDQFPECHSAGASLVLQIVSYSIGKVLVGGH